MSLTAQNPGERADEAKEVTPGILPVSADPSTEHSIAQTPSLAGKRTAQILSSRSRLITGWCLVASAIVVGALLQGNPGEQPTRLLAIVSASVALVAACIEAFATLRNLSSVRTPFIGLPFAGSLLITGSVLGLVWQDPSSLSMLVVVGPLLGSATLFFGRSISIRGTNLGRGDFSYLFPRSIDGVRDTQQGAVVSLKAGDVASVDLRITRGSVAVDERILSTVPTFRIREEDEVIYSGSEVIAGSVEGVALSSTQESSLQQLQRALAPMIEDAQNSLKREDAGAARGTALALVFLAVAAAISWNERTSIVEMSLLAAGVVLLGGTICQVSDLLYGLRRSLVQRWLQHGLVLSSASACKSLAGISQIVVDPSRVATGSRHVVSHIEVMDDRLSHGALCDFLSSLLGRAEGAELIAAGEYCRHHAARLSVERVLDLREYPGRGICGTVHGIELSIGNEDFLVERGIMVQPTDGDDHGEAHESIVLVAIDDDVVARFWISSSQEHLVAEDSHAGRHGVPYRLSSGVAQELSADTLLVRGSESDLVGQIARHDVALFSPKDAEIRRSTVLALAPEVGGLSELIAECRSQSKLVERTRILIGFSGLVLVASVFAGLITPVVPLGLLLLVAVSLRLS
jgi:cation transport ATPase